MRPYTDKAKKAVSYANRLSKSMQCNYVGTEHILAGLLREGSGVAEKHRAHRLCLSVQRRLRSALTAMRSERSICFFL